MRLINKHPSVSNGLILAALPFAIMIAIYMVSSEIRLAANPSDKLLPGFSTILDGITRMAFMPDKRSGNYLLWMDTAASLLRLTSGVLISVLLSAILGVAIGLLPYLRKTFSSFIAVVSMIPPLAILPILFILFGLGELSKVILVVIGITPFLVRDVAMRVSEIPAEQIIKAQTLGASTWQICTRVILPQIWPRLIDALRLSLGAAWLFLIAAEAIASQSGLGYRIFLLRRYLAMDVILPYVAWITMLAFIYDWLLVQLQTRLFPWFVAERSGS